LVIVDDHLTRCERCDQADRQPVQRAKLAERDGRVAIVLEVPMQECPACGGRWLGWEVARRLDFMLDAMLAGDVEVATRHYQETDFPAG
jgi:YgiT-type zinc finger domain-containing protein